MSIMVSVDINESWKFPGSGTTLDLSVSTLETVVETLSRTTLRPVRSPWSRDPLPDLIIPILIGVNSGHSTSPS